MKKTKTSPVVTETPTVTRRTPDTIQIDYQQTALTAGDLAYRIQGQQGELTKLYARMLELNQEMTLVRAEIAAEQVLQAKAKDSKKEVTKATKAENHRGAESTT